MRGGRRRTRTSSRRSRRRRSRYTRRGVVGGDDSLGHVGAGNCPHNDVVLLVADVEKQREAVLGDEVLQRNRDLLGDLSKGFLEVGVVSVGRILGVAVELLFLGVDGLQTRSALVVGHGGGCALQLLLQRVDFSSESINLGLLGLVLLLHILNGLLALIGGEDGLLESNQCNLCGNGLRGSGCCCGRGGCRCRCASSLGHPGGGRQSHAKGGDKNKGAIHAVCSTPSEVNPKIIRP